MFIAGGLIWLWGVVGRYADSPWGKGLFLLSAMFLIFCTAYVIPYFAFDRVYRTELEGAPPNAFD